MNNKLIIFGGGGHCKSIIDSIKKTNFDSIIIVDSIKEKGTHVGDFEIIGNFSCISKLKKNGYNYAFIGIGGFGPPTIREKILEIINKENLELINIIDTTSIISSNIIMGKGNFIGKGSILNSGCKIGNNTIINTGSIIEHDNEIGDFANIAPGCILLGGVKIGKRTQIGSGTHIRQNVNIGPDVIIGMGSLVLNNIPNGTQGYGRPFQIKAL